MYNFPIQPIDLFDKAPLTKADVQIFTATQFSQGWQTWYKPRGVTQSYMLTIAGGGGGGAGFTRAAGANGGGGGGGACSGVTRLITPSFFLPDVLYVQVGQGGLGGATSGTAGAPGTNSYISLGHSNAAPNVILASGINAPGGGGAGTGAAAGAAGSVPTVATTVATHQYGHWFGTVGLVGVAGGFTATTGQVGNSVTAWGLPAATPIPLSPGAGGGGIGTSNTEFAGGGQTANAAVDWGNRNWPITAGFLAPGGAGVGGNGSAGVMSWQPFFMTGGGGGGTNNTGVGGSGGNGGIGCGGGGGGSGITGGRGGNGGSGLVMIISW